MGINEMEFQWRLNWWYRPNQLDDFGTSVTDYYEYFCDWKNSMILNSCPANESDYVDAFIQNLKQDIRLRLESKGRSSTMRRLSAVFNDAKFEECLISLEETIKKFEARNLFDKMPSQEHSSDEVMKGDEEHSGSKVAESSCSEKDTCKLLDELTEPILAESSSIDQVLENDDSTTAYETSIDQIGDEENDEILVKREENPVKDVSPKVDDKVLDDLPHPIFIQTAGYKLVERVSDADSWPNSHAETTFDQFLGITEDGALKCHNKPTGIQLMETDEGSFLTKQTDLKIGYKVFDEMPRLFFVEPKKKINGGMDSITPIDCVPRVFDPGTLISLGMHNELFNTLLLQSVIVITYHAYTSKTFDINFDLMVEEAAILRDKMLDSAVCGPGDLRYEAGALGDISTKISPNSKYELYENFCVVEMSMLVFDPGD